MTGQEALRRAVITLRANGVDGPEIEAEVLLRQVLQLDMIDAATTEQLAGFRACVRFEHVEPRENRRRSYDLAWQPTLFGEGALVRSWGLLGQAGRTRVTLYPGRDDAQPEVRQVLRRLLHGYRVVDWQ
jgi:predicted DNA-binding WGR domain protein